MKYRRLAVPVVAIVLASSVAAQDRPSAPGRTEQGRRLFMDQGCYGCHTLGKLGTPIGPDLSHVGAKYPEAYLKSWLRDPAQQRPSAHMPRLELTEAQVLALAAFLASLE
jgi:cytochrome c oxidase subunit 2